MAVAGSFSSLATAAFFRRRRGFAGDGWCGEREESDDVERALVVG